MHPRYQEWIAHVFDHPVTARAWHWASDAPSFEADETQTALLLGETFSRAWIDLARFADDQVNQGIWYLADQACSDHSFSLRSDKVPLDLRLQGIRSIYSLYRDCFASRCSEGLSHLERGPSLLNALNSICYMFWDVTVLGCLEGSKDEAALADAVFEVLELTLDIPHLACKEAAIHGLGEFSCFYPSRVETVVDRFLDGWTGSALLKDYAVAARTGNIQ